MKLKEYLDEMGISQIKFARRCGVDARTIHNILKGKQDIRLSIALKIEELTDGKVTPKDLDPRENS